MEYRKKKISLIVPLWDNLVAENGSRNKTILRTANMNELINAIRSLSGYLEELRDAVRSLPKDPEELLDVEGVRLLLGGGEGKMAGETTITNWRKSGILRSIKIGNGRNAAVRFRRQDVIDDIRQVELKQLNKTRKK